MSAHDAEGLDPKALRAAVRCLGSCRRVTVLTGAGVSTDSGLPDYRGPQGVWTRDPRAERLSHIDAYVADGHVRAQVWQDRVATADAGIEPNEAHRALARLERAGRLDVLVTQNIDGLHHDAGSSPGRIVEVHGNVREVVCLACGDRGAAGPVLDRVRAGDHDPRCRHCGGLLKSATVSFGQMLDPDDLERAQRAAAECDLLLAAGTSLTVHPVARLPALALAGGAALVVCNAEATPYDADATAVLRGPVGVTLPALVDRAVHGGP